VDFADRFELLETVNQEIVREDDIQTFRARERATGRAVEVHFAASPELLASLGQQRMIDQGSHEGKPYVVTAPLTLDSAGAWRVNPVQSSPPPGDFTRMFKLHQAPEPVTVPASKPVQPVPAVTAPGDFTRAFQKPAPVASLAPSAASEPGQPGEFTRMFQQPVAQSAASVPAPPVAASNAMEPGTEAPVRKPSKLIVIGGALLLAIVVLILLRRLY
jgi:hypothetical protein